MEEDIVLGRTEMMFGLFKSNIKRLRVTMDYTEQALRDVIESDKNTLKIWSLCMNMISDLLATFSFVKQLEQVRKSSIEYDYYNEIRDIIDDLETRLTRFNKICLTDIGGDILYFVFNHSDNIKILNKVSQEVRAKINAMEEYKNENLKMFEKFRASLKKLRKKYSNEKQFENFINFTEADVVTQLLSVPIYLEILIQNLQELTMLQYERSNEELLRIYEEEKRNYEKNVFAAKWTNYLAQLKKTTFRFKPMTASSLEDVYNELCKTLKELPLGVVYLADYESEEMRAYKYNKLQCRHSEWEVFFYTSLKYEYLCNLIQQKMIEENEDNIIPNVFPESHYAFIKAVSLDEKKRKIVKLSKAIADECKLYCSGKNRNCKACKRKSYVIKKVFKDVIKELDYLPKYNVFNDLLGDSISISEPGYNKIARDFSERYHIKKGKQGKIY